MALVALEITDTKKASDTYKDLTEVELYLTNDMAKSADGLALIYRSNQMLTTLPREG